MITHGPFSLGGLTARELGRRVWKRMYDDAAWDTAAQLGYYFMLALFPLILFLGSLLTILHALNIVEPLLLTLRRVMPLQAFTLLSGELERVMSVPRGDLLTFGAVAAVWASSSGVEALLNALNRAYEVSETRSYVKVRGTAILMTFVIGFMIILGGALLMFGDRIAVSAAARLAQPWVSVAGSVGNYLLGLILMFLGLEVVYYYGPNVANQKWRWVSPGSFVAILLFVLSSSGFSLYVRYSDSYSAMYGSIGAVIIMMFWLYILALAFITGGEINAQVAAAARAQGEADAPMVGVEAEPPKPDETPDEGPDPSIGLRADDDPIRELIEAVRREHGHVRAALVVALGAAGPDAEPAVPDLVVMLGDEHPVVRAEVVAALAQIGKSAASALPALRELLQSEDTALHEAAARAIASIESGGDQPQEPEAGRPAIQ